MEQALRCTESFFRLVESGEPEIYNEFSLEHELGIHLRNSLSGDYKVQFERPVSSFGPRARKYRKKEIDISIFTADQARKAAIEVKFPRNGQYPEQMFKACEDISFLEELVADGFELGLFVMAADDVLFYKPDMAEGIYSYFRNQRLLHGSITKPTGAKGQFVTVQGGYTMRWKSAGGNLKYCAVEVGPTRDH